MNILVLVLLGYARPSGRAVVMRCCKRTPERILTSIHGSHHLGRFFSLFVEEDPLSLSMGIPAPSPPPPSQIFPNSKPSLTAYYLLRYFPSPFKQPSAPLIVETVDSLIWVWSQEAGCVWFSRSPRERFDLPLWVFETRIAGVSLQFFGQKIGFFRWAFLEELGCVVSCSGFGERIGFCKWVKVLEIDNMRFCSGLGEKDPVFYVDFVLEDLGR